MRKAEYIDSLSHKKPKPNKRHAPAKGQADNRKSGLLSELAWNKGLNSQLRKNDERDQAQKAWKECASSGSPCELLQGALPSTWMTCWPPCSHPKCILQIIIPSRAIGTRRPKGNYNFVELESMEIPKDRTSELNQIFFKAIQALCWGAIRQLNRKMTAPFQLLYFRLSSWGIYKDKDATDAA